MRPSAYNPTRRNRNIGTAAQGHGVTNEFVIPGSWRDSRAHWEKLRDVTVTRRRTGARHITFLVERLAPGFVHHCTVGDVRRILTLLPAEDWAGISYIVFRQPTRKQSVLNGVWARLAYWADFGVFAGQHFEGPAVIIEAVALKPWRSQRAGVDFAAEIDRLRNDGHEIEERRKNIKVTPSSDAIRATQLYRSLPHEIGHWVQWRDTVLTGSAAEMSARENAYFRLAHREREAFAHVYADRVVGELQSQRLIPFLPIAEEIIEP